MDSLPLSRADSLPLAARADSLPLAALLGAVDVVSPRRAAQAAALAAASPSSPSAAHGAAGVRSVVKAAEARAKYEEFEGGALQTCKNHCSLKGWRELRDRNGRPVPNKDWAAKHYRLPLDGHGSCCLDPNYPGNRAAFTCMQACMIRARGAWMDCLARAHSPGTPQAAGSPARLLNLHAPGGTGKKPEMCKGKSVDTT
mgnify:CR=1 FL=1